MSRTIGWWTVNFEIVNHFDYIVGIKRFTASNSFTKIKFRNKIILLSLNLSATIPLKCLHLILLSLSVELRLKFSVKFHFHYRKISTKFTELYASHSLSSCYERCDGHIFFSHYFKFIVLMKSLPPTWFAPHFSN